MAKNIIFCSILLICSITISSVKLPNKQICDDNYNYSINTSGGRVMVVSEAFWKNRLQPDLNGLPSNPREDDEENDYEYSEELENFDDGNLILRGGDTEVYDSKGQKLKLSELDVWDEDLDDVLDDESELQEVDKLVFDGHTEVVHPRADTVVGEKVTEGFELVDVDSEVFNEAEEKLIEEEVFGSSK